MGLSGNSGCHGDGTDNQGRKKRKGRAVLIGSAANFGETRVAQDTLGMTSSLLEAQAATELGLASKWQTDEPTCWGTEVHTRPLHMQGNVAWSTWGQSLADAGQLYGKLLGNSGLQAQTTPKEAQFAEQERTRHSALGGSTGIFWETRRARG